MSTIYNALKNNFTQVSNHALLDINLSSKAYKLYAYMCYRIGISDSWEFNEPEILKHFKEKRDAMREAKNELIDSGYLVKIQTRNSKGFFHKNNYKILAEPQNKGSDPSPENPSTDNPSSGKPSSGKPSTENKTYNKKDLINKDSSNKDFISSIEEAKKYWTDNNFKSDPEEFFDLWEGRGWKDGKTKIVDRVAYARKWERKYKKMNPDLYKITLNSANSDSTVALNEPISINNNDPLWLKLSNLLNNDFDKEVFDKWLSKLNFVHEKDGIITLATETKFLRDWIKREYSNSILSSFQKLQENLKAVKIVNIELQIN